MLSGPKKQTLEEPDIKTYFTRRNTIITSSKEYSLLQNFITSYTILKSRRQLVTNRFRQCWNITHTNILSLNLASIIGTLRATKTYNNYNNGPHYVFNVVMKQFLAARAYSQTSQVTNSATKITCQLAWACFIGNDWKRTNILTARVSSLELWHDISACPKCSCNKWKLE